MQFSFDPMRYRYPSRRNVVYGKKGMVATANPLAAQAGLEMLKKGGNAIDAAVAAAATLTVVEPCCNGMGGDAFAMVYSGGKLQGLNASGPSPAAITLEKVRALGYTGMPDSGVVPLTVPGAPSAWAALSGQYGRLPFEDLMAPAAAYAEEGFVVQPCAAAEWALGFRRFEAERAVYPELAGWFDTFAPGGQCVRAGQVLRLADHAATLWEIGRTRAESFYRGGLAEAIGGYVAKYGGFLTADDLAAYVPEWVAPLSTGYRGYQVYEMPPNGQGIAVLMALNILGGLPAAPCGSFEDVHRQIEALKLAFTDVQACVAEPRVMAVSTEEMLSAAYAEKRRGLMGTEALRPEAGLPRGSDTVYLCAADAEGNMVSYIQSNYMGFGSGVVVPGTGIALQNRGRCFSLDEKSDNAVGPSKRPYHTIIPGFLFKDGKPVGPFGVMGGFIQPQAHLQVLVNTIDHHMNPQEALDRPRWFWTGGKTIEAEPGLGEALFESLRRAGHDVVVNPQVHNFGRGEIIWRDGGVLCGGCEPRGDAMVAVW